MLQALAPYWGKRNVAICTKELGGGGGCEIRSTPLILQDNVNDRQMPRVKTFDILDVSFDEFRVNGTVDS